MAKLGDVNFTVTAETPVFYNSISSRPIEGGVIVDNVKQDTTMLSIVGAVTGEDSFIKLQQLRKYAREGAILKYTGRNIFSNMVIEKFETDHTVRIRNGFQFAFNLKEVRIAKSQIVEIKKPDPVSNKAPKKIKTQTKPVTNNGKQVPKPKPADIQRVGEVNTKYAMMF